MPPPRIAPRTRWIYLLTLLSFSPFLAMAVRAQSPPTIITGNLITDDDVQSTVFVVTQTQDYTFFTTSYAGGTNADNTQTAAGGFDPVLTLFDSTGNTIACNDDDTTGLMNTDTTSGYVGDAYFTQTLDAGIYTLAVSQYGNFAPDDILDYSEAGNLTYTSQFSNPFNPLPGPFLDEIGTQRTSSYTYDIVPGPFAAPEPSFAADFVLFLLSGVWFAARKRIATLG